MQPILHLGAKDQDLEKLHRLAQQTDDFTIVCHHEDAAQVVGTFKRTEKYETYLNNFLMQQKRELDAVQPEASVFNKMPEKSKLRRASTASVVPTLAKLPTPKTYNNKQQVFQVEHDATNLPTQRTQMSMYSSRVPHSHRRRPMTAKSKHEPHEIAQVTQRVQHVKKDNPFYCTAFVTEKEEHPPSMVVLKEHLEKKTNTRCASAPSKRPSSANVSSLLLEYKGLEEKLVGKEALGGHKPKEFFKHHIDYYSVPDVEDEAPEDGSSRNSTSRKSLQTMIRKFGNQTKSLASVRFPIEELLDSSKNLLKAKLGDKFIVETDVEPNMNDLFPMVCLRNPLPHSTLSGAHQTPASPGSFSVEDLENNDKLGRARRLKRTQSVLHAPENLDAMLEGINNRLQQLAVMTDMENQLTNSFDDMQSQYQSWISDVATMQDDAHNMSFPRSPLSARQKSPSRLKNTFLTQFDDEDSPKRTSLDPFQHVMSARSCASSTSKKKMGTKKSKDSSNRNWSKQFLHSQIELQNVLLDKLEARALDKEKIYKSPAHLSLIAKQALKHAYEWKVNRSQKSFTPKSDMTTANSSSDLSQMAKQEAQMADGNIWRRARQDMDQHNEQFFQAITFYRRLLMFLEYIKAPTQIFVLEFVHLIRNELIRNGSVFPNMLWDAMTAHRALMQKENKYEPDVLLNNKEALKIIYFMRSEMKLTMTHLFAYLDSTKWYEAIFLSSYLP